MPTDTTPRLSRDLPDTPRWGRPPADDPMREAYCPAEAARLLGVTRRTVDRAIARGEIRIARLGRRVLIARVEIDRLLGITTP